MSAAPTQSTDEGPSPTEVTAQVATTVQQTEQGGAEPSSQPSTTGQKPEDQATAQAQQIGRSEIQQKLDQMTSEERKTLRDAIAGRIKAPEQSQSAASAEPANGAGTSDLAAGTVSGGGEQASHEEGSQASSEKPAEGTTEDQDGSNHEKGSPTRFRFQKPDDQAIALIAKAQGVSLAEASDIYRAGIKSRQVGDQAASAQQQAQAQQNEQPTVDPKIQNFDKSITEIEAKIKDLSTQRQKARDDIETARADELNDQIADLRADLRIAQANKSRYVEQQGESVQTQVQASFNKALEKHPNLADPLNVDRLAFNGFFEVAQRDPQYAAILSRVDWPERLVEVFVEKYRPANAASVAKAQGQQEQKPNMAQAQQRVSKPIPQQVLAANGSKLITGAVGQRSAASSHTLQEKIDEVQSTPEGRRALIRAMGQLKR